MVNQIERAYHAWPILVDKAAKKKTITYGALASQIGLSHHRPLRYVLGILQDYCLEENLPPLTILVVDQSGNRGSGFIAWSQDNQKEGENQVFTYPWQEIQNPFLFASDGLDDYQNLASKLISNPDTANEIFSKVKVRGVAQQIFRSAILKVYDGKCAFSGIPIKETLEAVHIVPWSKCEPKYRVHIGNGILLSSIHHKLFDNGMITLKENYIISVSEELLFLQNTSKLLKAIISQIDGKMMRLPSNKINWPLVELIKLRNRMQNEYEDGSK